jgi:DNA polymerase-3 subunit alpha
MRLARWYQKHFGENFFIEVMSHGASGGVDHVKVEEGGNILMDESDLNRSLVSIANNLGIGIAATNDAHYLLRDHGGHHDTLLCVGMGAWKDKAGRMRFPGAAQRAHEFYIKSEAEMRLVSPEPWWLSACTNTQTIADSIDEGVVELGQNIQPKFKIPDDPEFLAWEAKYNGK